jgi:hypothetical protein
VIADSLVMEGLGSEVFSIKNSGSTTSIKLMLVMTAIPSLV